MIKQKRTKGVVAWMLIAIMMLSMAPQTAFAESGQSSVKNIEIGNGGPLAKYIRTTPKFSQEVKEYEVKFPIRDMATADTDGAALPVTVTLEDEVEAEVVAQYTDMDGNKKSVELTAGKRKNLPDFFAWYTRGEPAASNDVELEVTDKQGQKSTYLFHVYPVLICYNVSITDTTGYAKSIGITDFDETEEGDYELDYSYPVSDVGKEIEIGWWGGMDFPNASKVYGYGARWFVDGAEQEKQNPKTKVELDGKEQNFTGYMACNGKWKSAKYTIHIKPTQQKSTVNFNLTTKTEDTGIKVRLYDCRRCTSINGGYGYNQQEITADKDNPVQFSGLEDGAEYLYEATSDHYRTVWGRVRTDGGNQKIDVALEEKADLFDEAAGLKTMEFCGLDFQRRSDMDSQYNGAEVYYAASEGSAKSVPYSISFDNQGILSLKKGNSLFELDSASEGTSLVVTGYGRKSTVDPAEVLKTVQIQPGGEGSCRAANDLDSISAAFFGSTNQPHGNTLTLELKKGQQTIKTYKLLVDTTPYFYWISANSGELKLPLKDFSSDPSEQSKEYTIDSSEYRVDSITLCGETSNSNCKITLNGENYDPGDETAVRLNADPTQPKDAVFELTQTYTDKTGRTSTSTNQYTLHLLSTGTKTPPWLDFAALTLDGIDPADAAVTVYDSDGKNIEADADNPYRFSKIIKDREYRYTISKYGYASASDTFTLTEDKTITVDPLKRVDTSYEDLEDIQWGSFRNSVTNNGVTSYPTPTDSATTFQKWAVKLGVNYTTSTTPPLILDGKLYSGAGRNVMILDRDTGQTLKTSDKLEGSVGYAMNPITYGEGKLFVPLGNGRIQCLDAKTLKSLWVSEAILGQNVSPITYRDGYVYSGTWDNETRSGTYYCINVADEDPSSPTETKRASWRLTPEGRGFYWAGAYVDENCAVFGSDDGSREGLYVDKAVLYSVHPKTGKTIDTVEGLKGDIRSTITYDDGKVYFSTKGGMLYRVVLNKDGTFGKVSGLQLGGMATGAPLIYNGRIYLGVCGDSQFDADAGHGVVVVNDGDTMTLAWSRSTPGYPQAGAVMTKAYANEDYNGDGKPDNRVYIYFTCNAPPGGIYYIYDEPGMTDKTAPKKVQSLFTPEKAQQEFCISTLCIDSKGTIYYKNDSAYVMAVATNKAYLSGLSLKAAGKTIELEEDFEKGTLSYKAYVPEGTKTADINLNLEGARTATINGTAYTGKAHTLTLKGGEAKAEIVVTYDGMSRTYTLTVSSNNKNADLGDLTLGYQSQKGLNRIETNETFDPSRTEYTSKAYINWNIDARPDGESGDLEQDKKIINYINLWPQTSDSRGTIKVFPVEGVDLDNRNMDLEEDGSILSPGDGRYPVYFADGWSSAKVRIQVTASDGKTKKTYSVTLNRWDCYGPQLSQMKAARSGETSAKVTFTSNETGSYYYAVITKGSKKPEINTDGAGIALKKGSNTLALSKLTISAKDIYVACKDAKGNVSEAKKVTLAEVPKTISLSRTSVQLYSRGSGSSVTLKATANPKGSKVTWKSSNTKVAVVSSSGKVTAKKAGSAIITATNGASKTCKVTVRNPSFKLTKSSVKVKKGKTYRIKSKASPKSKIKYKSSKKKIATVNSKGIVKGKKKGKAVIRVTCNGITRTLKVTVK